MASVRTLKTEDVSMVSAIETLSSIADLGLASTLQDPLINSSQADEAPVVLRTVRWLHQKNAEHMISIVREKLHDVLVYFKHCFGGKRERIDHEEFMEGARTVMLLVDEAAENLDRYTKLFLGSQRTSLKETKEFLDLCDFYNSKILAKASEAHASERKSTSHLVEILEKVRLTPSKMAQQISTIPLSVELEDLQKDIDYELLFIRKADGSRFFTQKLIRSLKLACDIEQAVDWQGTKQQRAEIDEMKGEQAATEARYLLNSCYPLLDAFFHSAHRFKDHQLVMDVYSPTIGLMEAAIQSIHRPAAHQTKGGEEYLSDFRTLFLEAIHSPEFKRLHTYPQSNTASWEYALLKLSENLASRIVDGALLSKDVVSAFKGLLNQGMSMAVEELGLSDDTLSKTLELNFSALGHLLGKSMNATLVRMLQELQDRQTVHFEPLVDQALPMHLYDLSWHDDLIPIVRLPSPTRQEKIDSAVPSEIFQMALHDDRGGRKALLINVQDRTNWKDWARCKAIEELQEQGAVSVVSWANDSDWYRQEGVYESLTSAEQFKQELMDQIKNTHLPQSMRGTIERDLLVLFDCIHKSLYGGRNVLSKAQRLEWIGLVTTLLFLRAIGETNPSTIFVSCKDGLDGSLSTIASLFAFLKLFNQRTSSEEDIEWLGAMLSCLPLMERDRLPFVDRYSRMTSYIRFLEGLFRDESEATLAIKKAVTAFLPKDEASAAMLPAVRMFPPQAPVLS